MSEWRTVSERPNWEAQPGRQFIRLEGSKAHSGANWHRVYIGEAFLRKPGAADEMLQYRLQDVLRLCRDGDMDPETAQVTHWMPAIYPAIPSTHHSSPGE